MVDVVVEPPASVITLNGFIINIEKYVENTSANKKAAAWMNISPKLGHEIIPGRIYEDDETAGDEGSASNKTSFANVAKQGRPREEGPKDVDMAKDDEDAERATKRRAGPEETAKAESGAAKVDESAQLVKKLMEKQDQKDEQIAQMLATIEGLLTKMAAKGSDI